MSAKEPSTSQEAAKHKATGAQTRGFETEVKQLLHLMIHSLYSNKEIFLRELISNASDACDKLRFEAIDHPELISGDPDLRIRVDYDPKAHTITVDDNGIGMSYDELISNLGTIARSGTKEFLSQLTGDKQKDAHLIGQFGVGFYSSFIVAKKVSVLSRRAGLGANEAALWESQGEGEYTIEPAEKASRGTTITLYLRDDEEEFLNGWRLREILKRYSDHISIPVQMRKEEWNEETKEQEKTKEWENVNQASALWTRPRNEITDEQYIEFYKHIAHDFEEPLAWTHNQVEGRSEYTQLLYIPQKAPFDLWDRDAKHGLKLYVKRVFIMDDAQQLLPSYLRFVRGIVDSSDLPLNVSREILQQSRDVRSIREGCARRVLALLDDMAKNEPKKYETFWTQFGQVLKEGTGEDAGNLQRIAKLLRFASTHNDSAVQNVSLDDYLERMKEGQKHIYYVGAESYEAAAHSPHLEVFRKKGIEVLLLSDRIDEWMLSFLTEYKDHQLVSVAKGGVDLDDLADEDEKKHHEEVAKQYQPLVERLKKSLGDAVKEVRVTMRLVDSPACVVVDEGEMSPHFLRLLEAAGQETPTLTPILEINPDHSLLSHIQQVEGDEAFTEWAQLLLDQAMLAEGAQLKDPARFVQRLNQLLMQQVEK